MRPNISGIHCTKNERAADSAQQKGKEKRELDGRKRWIMERVVFALRARAAEICIGRFHMGRLHSRAEGGSWKSRVREVAWILQYESVLNADMVVIYGRPLARLPQDPLPSLHLSCAVSIWTVWRELTHSCPISRKLCLVYSILAPV